MFTVRRRPPKRRKTPEAVVWGVAVLAVLLCVEGAARLLYKKPWLETLLEQQLRAPYPAPKLNEFGLRDGPVLPRRGSRETRLLILGDSFTYGSGMQDAGKTFPRLLEGALSRDLGRPVHVLNGGLPGSIPRDWADLLDKVGPRYEPDAIVAVFFMRDGAGISTMAEFFGPIRKLAYRHRESFLYRHCYAYRVVQDALLREAVGNQYSQAIRDAYLNPPKNGSWERAQLNLKRIGAYARSRRIPFGFAVFPILIELDDDHPFAVVEAEVADFGRRSGWPVLDLLPSFKGHPAHELWVSPYNQHPNEKGHALAAGALEPFAAGLLREKR